MRIRVRLFAGLREQAGGGERELELPRGSRLADVWAPLGLGDEPEGLLYAVNKDYATSERLLADGDEVAVIPPVSGGEFRLTADPIDVGAVIAAVADERRARSRPSWARRGSSRAAGRSTTSTTRPTKAWPRRSWRRSPMGSTARYDLCKIAITHRIGRVGIGETSVAIAVSAPHRDHALAACKEAIDTLKVDVPLWKKEVYEGGEEWIGRGS